MRVSQRVSGTVTGLALRLLYGLSLKGTRSFEYALGHLETVQRAILSRLLKNAGNSPAARLYGLSENLSYEAFAERMPLTRYAHWEQAVTEQKTASAPILTRDVCTRYQPTSGSSSKMKWIPYTPSFLRELDCAVSPMLVDAFQTYPRVMNGRHYWSLSWIPTHLRTSISPDANDDMKLLPWWKRLFLGVTMAVPNDIAFAPTSEGSIVASLAHLLSCPDLSMMSVWSPTFAINLFEQMARHKDELSAILRSGSWGERQADLFHIPCPAGGKASADALSAWDGTVEPGILQALWPKLALVSSWDTSSSAIWARELKRLLPQAAFVGKGLWATEGVVTIPYRGRYPLAATSHFYEFIDPDTERIHPAWDLAVGQIVRPLLTTGSGFFRYDLNDQLRVTGFLDRCPCFEFLGRTEGIDMIGEKLTPDIAAEVLRKTGERFGLKALTLLALPGNGSRTAKPRYHLLCEADPNPSIESEAAAYASALLDESFHYKLATEIGQLAPLAVVFHPRCRTLYQERNVKRGMILGDMKIEPLVMWDESDAAFLERLTSSPDATFCSTQGA
ncbi:GH3 auxin-responsive promoter family protein [Desulfatiferula olefinivorans]